MKFKTIKIKPIKVVFNTKDNLKKNFNVTKAEFPIIELKGEPIESFERISKIKEIILLGQDNEIRRIIIR